MKFDRTDTICLVAIILHVVIVAVFYSDLPDPVPTHWNAEGMVDGYTAKPWGAWLLPMITLGVFVLFKIIPWMSPHGFRMESFLKVVNIMKLTTVLFMLVIGVTVVLAARGAPFDPGDVVLPGVGVLLVVLGNYMGKLRKNFFIGIRTPWTLASDEVWARTHRLGAQVFVVLGIVMMLSALTGWPPLGPVLIAIIVLAALIPVIYSFVIYRQLEGFGPDSEQ